MFFSGSVVVASSVDAVVGLVDVVVELVDVVAVLVDVVDVVGVVAEVLTSTTILANDDLVSLSHLLSFA